MAETTTTFRPGQMSGKVRETVFKHGTQTVSLHIYLDQGYYLNVQVFCDRELESGLKERHLSLIYGANLSVAKRNARQDT